MQLVGNHQETEIAQIIIAQSDGLVTWNADVARIRRGKRKTNPLSKLPA